MAKITVYSTSSCPRCVKAKEFLKQHNIKFEEKNVAKDEQARNKMMEKSGQMSVPVLDINGTIIIGFDKAAMEKAIKR